MLMIIDKVPMSKNKYVNQHWAKRRQYKDGILLKMEEQMELEIGLNPSAYKGLPYKQCKVVFTIFFDSKRRRDVHNYVGGGLVSWLDCMVDLKIIEDDCWDVIGQPLVFFDYDKEFPRTEILVEEVKRNK